MTDFSGKAARIDAPATEVYARLGDFSNYQTRLDALPEEQRKMLGDVRFTSDSIIITAQPVGEITLQVAERVAPSLIRLEALGSPVPMFISISISPDDADPAGASNVVPMVSVDLPVMLKPLVGPKLQESADKFGELITKLFQ